MVRLIYGDHTEFIYSIRRNLIEQASREGKNVMINPEVEEVESMLSGFFAPEPSLVVWDDAAPKKCQPYWKNSPLDFLVILKDPKKSPWLEFADKSTEFKAPKPWEAAQKAAVHFQSTLEANHRKISLDLAESVVNLSGSDFGILYFEAFKILQVSQPGDTITVEHIRKTIAPLASPDGDRLISAISRRDPKSIVTIMDRIERNSSADPTMAITMASLQPMFLRWYFALLDPAIASETLGMNPYVVEKKVLPSAKVIGKERVEKLISAIAEAHKSVSNGSKSSWNLLKFGILDAIT